MVLILGLLLFPRLAKSSELGVDEALSLSDEVFLLSDISKERIGVSLAALTVLSYWAPGTFQPLDYLQRSGRIELMEELERKGFAVIHESDGLPDGTQKGTRQIRLEPTKSGLEVVAAFLVLIDEASQ